MKRSLFLACCVATIAAPVTFATAADAPGMTAAQVIDKNVAARGGLQAWRAVNTITLSGELDAGGKAETKLPFVLSMKRPHKSRLEIRFQDRPAVQVYDGTQGWKQRPFLGRDDVEAFTKPELKSAAAAAELDGPLIDYARKGSKVEMVGVEAVEGKNAYKVKLTPANGVAMNVWIDATSFLEVKMDGEPRKLDGRLHKVAIYSRDYKAESGLMVPHTMETVVEGVKQSHKMIIQSVKVNPSLNDSLFAKPQGSAAKAAAAQ
jgi:outer membrane lipoprotein-sorting protein